jgi:hypothetical protein
MLWSIIQVNTRIKIEKCSSGLGLWDMPPFMCSQLEGMVYEWVQHPILSRPLLAILFLSNRKLGRLKSRIQRAAHPSTSYCAK